jgi:hypothetical protein
MSPERIKAMTGVYSLIRKRRGRLLETVTSAGKRARGCPLCLQQRPTSSKLSLPPARPKTPSTSSGFCCLAVGLATPHLRQSLRRLGSVDRQSARAQQQMRMVLLQCGNSRPQSAAMGHKRPNCDGRAMSACRPKATIGGTRRSTRRYAVRFTPKAPCRWRGRPNKGRRRGSRW